MTHRQKLAMLVVFLGGIVILVIATLNTTDPTFRELPADTPPEINDIPIKQSSPSSTTTKTVSQPLTIVPPVVANSRDEVDWDTFDQEVREIWFSDRPTNDVERVHEEFALRIDTILGNEITSDTKEALMQLQAQAHQDMSLLRERRDSRELNISQWRTELSALFGRLAHEEAALLTDDQFQRLFNMEPPTP